LEVIMAVGEWDQRQLCPDDGCIGVIGPDGTCKVCGHAAQNWGDERKRGLIDPPDEDGDEAGDDEDEKPAYVPGSSEDEDEDDVPGDDDDDDDEGDESVEDTPHHIVAAGSSPIDWGSRQLCADGACIGVIGIDGTCKTCGRTAPGAQRATPAGPSVAREVASGTRPVRLASDLGIADTVTAGDPNSTKLMRCADPTCAGVSGPDGHCEVCGKVVT
jgi:hypothetical protein